MISTLELSENILLKRKSSERTVTQCQRLDGKNKLSKTILLNGSLLRIFILYLIFNFSTFFLYIFYNYRHKDNKSNLCLKLNKPINKTIIMLCLAEGCAKIMNTQCVMKRLLYYTLTFCPHMRMPSDLKILN